MFSFESTNPVLNNRNLPRDYSAKPMTMSGAVNKSLILGGLLIITGLLVSQVADPATYNMWMIGGLIGGLISALITSFKPEWAATTAPIYAICEGAALSTMTMLVDAIYPGVGLNAFFLTAGTLMAMLLCYKSGWIQVTDKLRSGIVVATAGIALMYLVSFIAGLFGANMSFMYNSSPLSIGISLVVVLVAALSLLLDFELIDQVAARRSPEYMEWYAGFALLVTLVWLYVEFLKLLTKLQRRD